jgi:hypothetical protein
VNGQIKEGRGLRRFLLRGLEKVDGEWHLIAATPQPAQAVQAQAITAAGAVDRHRLKGHGPGGGSQG